VLTPQLADRCIERFNGGFDGFDFSSKVKNPQLELYSFDFAHLLEALNARPTLRQPEPHPL
jgi:hypothetical protein